jgi:Ser/Thr protein kinase RdoA (MazF antagonist)
MGFDVIATDLARLLGEWPQLDYYSMIMGLDAYTKVNELPPEQLSLFNPLCETGRVLLGERWVRWHFLEKRSFADPHLVHTRLEHGIQRLRHGGPWGHLLSGSRESANLIL